MDPKRGSPQASPEDGNRKRSETPTSSSQKPVPKDQNYRDRPTDDGTHGDEGAEQAEALGH
jgi:hypothetical protein